MIIQTPTGHQIDTENYEGESVTERLLVSSLKEKERELAVLQAKFDQLAIDHQHVSRVCVNLNQQWHAASVDIAAWKLWLKQQPEVNLQ